MTFVDRFKFAAALAAMTVGVVAPVATQASVPVDRNNSVILSSEAMIERTETGTDGKERVVAKQPKDVIVIPGDRVIFTLTYVNNGAEPATGFRATNPMPGPVQFVSAAEPWAEVSVDGGKSWGRLDQLKVTKAGIEGATAELRAATAEDVTHVRWVFSSPIAPGAKGSLSFRGVIK
jgi:uncharacterized repeat protein (TIGR01451 family)